MWDKLFASADLMQRGLDAAWLRNEVIRNNLANAETPGFKSSDVVFEDAFAQALRAEDAGLTRSVTHPRHFSGRGRVPDVTATVVQNNTRSMRMDGNNLDVEDENVKLAQNSIQYNTLVYKLNSELRRLSMAITEGR
jgi:flagellar basal-body rod protein FlgB